MIETIRQLPPATPPRQREIVARLEAMLEAAKAGEVRGIALAYIGRQGCDVITVDGYEVEDFCDALMLSGLCTAIARKLYDYEA